MAKITYLSLYIINRVKLLRIVLNIPPSRISTFLNHTPAYVFNVEKESLDTHYPTHEWPKLAHALNCDIHDLLPPDNIEKQSTGDLVDKIVFSLNNYNDLKVILNALIENEFFVIPKSTDDIVKHLHLNQPLQKKSLEELLVRFSEESVLKTEGSYYSSL